MDIKNITKFFAELPSDIREQVMSVLVATSVATKKVEHDFTTLDVREVGNMTQAYTTGNHFKDMLAGINSESVKEYVKRYYMILEKSDSYETDKNGNRRDSELYQQNYKQKLLESSDNSDFDDLDYIVTNKKMMLEGINGGEYSPIKIIREVPKKFNIEDFTDSVHVKNIENKYKALEFYLDIDSTHPLYKSILNQPTFFSDFESVGLTKTKYRDVLKNYKIMKHFSLAKYKNNLVIKFLAIEI